MTRCRRVVPVAIAVGLITVAGCSDSAKTPTPLRLNGTTNRVLKDFDGTVDWRLTGPQLAGSNVCTASFCALSTVARSGAGKTAVLTAYGRRTKQRSGRPGRLVGVDLQHGKVSWRRSWPADTVTDCRPIADASRWACVRIATKPGPDAELIILDASDGHRIARRKLEHAVGPLPELTTDGSSIWTVSTVGDSLIFGSATRKLQVNAYDDSGKLDWTQSVPVSGADEPQIHVVDGKLALVDPRYLPEEQRWLDRSSGRVTDRSQPIELHADGVVFTHPQDEPIMVSRTALPGTEGMRPVAPHAVSSWDGLPLFARPPVGRSGSLKSFTASDPAVLSWSRADAEPVAYCSGHLLLDVGSTRTDEHLERVATDTGTVRWKAKMSNSVKESWCAGNTVITQTYGQNGVTIRKQSDGTTVRTVKLRTLPSDHYWAVAEGSSGTSNGLLFYSVAGLVLVD